MGEEETVGTEVRSPDGRRSSNRKIPMPNRDDLLALLAFYTIGEIAIQNSTTRQTVTTWLRHYGIQVGRGRGGGWPTHRSTSC